MIADVADPRFTPDQLAIVAAFEAAPVPPESFDPIAALRRVEALADQWEADAQRTDDAEPVSSDGLTRMILAARYLRMNASDLRAALASQADR